MPRTRLFIALTLGFSTLTASFSGEAASRRDYSPADWVLCRTNTLFDFYRPLSGSEAERDTASTSLFAESIDIRDEQQYVLQGDVEILRADQRVAAALLRFNPQDETWQAEGKVQYQDSGMLMEASRASGDLTAEMATLETLRYQLLSVRGNGQANLATNQGNKSQLSDVSYSTCDPEDPHWAIRARRLDINQETGMATVRNASLRLGKVPLLYFPMATFPIDDRRKSGFLFPSLGASQARGTDIAIPYYINLAPNYDATLTPRLMTKRGAMLGAQFRYLSENHRGELYGAWLPNDSLSDRDRGTLTWKHRGHLSSNWQFITNVNHISDNRYFEDFGDSLTMAATSLLESEAAISGHGHHWNANIALQEWTVADPYLSTRDEPFRRLPRALFTWEYPLLSGFSAGLRSEGVVFEHPDRPGAVRADLYPHLNWQYERAAGFIRAEAGVRHTQYQLDNDYLPAFSSTSPSRTMPILSVDSGLVFERPLQLFDTRLLQTLEPRLYYLHVPYRDQTGLPIFDTQELGFSWGQLFRPNRFSGADRQSDANQATVAVTTRFFDEQGGRERLSASLGQIRYFQDQQIQMPGIDTIHRAGSAYVGDVSLMLDDRWSLSLSEQWDANANLSQLSTLRTQYRWSEAGVFNFAYRFRRDARAGSVGKTALEQIDTSLLLPLNERWRLVGRWNYSLLDNSTLEAFAGVEWESCCVAMRVLTRRYIRNFEGERNTSLYVELELKGLSTLGRKSEEFLERAILGYSH